MSDRSIPNNHIICLSGKRLFYRVAEIVSDIWLGVMALGLPDGGRVDINRIDLGALRAEKMIRDKAVSASDIEDDILRLQRFRGVKRANKLKRVHGARTKTK